MSLVTIVTVKATCDIDGATWELPNEGRDYQPFSFVVNNSRVEGEVCPRCQDKLMALLAPFASKMRTPAGAVKRAPQAQAAPGTRSTSYHDPREKELKPHPCLIPSCPNGYTTKKALNDHRRRDHGEHFEFVCRSEDCREEFETERGRGRHETEMHPDLDLTNAA